MLKSITTILLCIYLMGLRSYSQQPEKIHPVLYNLISTEKTTGRTIHSKGENPFYNITPTPAGNKLTQRGSNRYATIVYTTKPEILNNKGYILTHFTRNFGLAYLTLTEIETLSGMEEVDYIDASIYHSVENDIARSYSKIDLLQQGAINNFSYTGKGVIIGIIDTGIDFRHPDFRNPAAPNDTRIQYLWDQVLTPQAGETEGPYFTGVLYTKADIDAALSGTGTVRSMDVNSHGTHVAGTAAGNAAFSNGKLHKGMAPEADLIIVKAGDHSFSTENIIKALFFLDSIATAQNKPLVINLSIGGHGYAQDGNAPHEVVIDFLSERKTGRVITIAAGNSGNSGKHKSLTLAPGEEKDFTMNLTPAVDTTAGTKFIFNVFADADISIEGSMLAPDGTIVAAPIRTVDTSSTVDTEHTLIVANALYPASSISVLQFVVSKNNNNNNIAPSGTWTFRVKNKATTTRQFHGWIAGNIGSFQNIRIDDATNDYLITSPATARNAISVANYTGRDISLLDKINPSSSVGPARTGFLKPDIAAVGSHVISTIPTPAVPSSNFNQYYRGFWGTSMAAPVVAGGAALLLQAFPDASYNTIKTALIVNADTDTFTGTTPNTVWGNGKLNVLKAMSSLTGCPNNYTQMVAHDEDTGAVNLIVNNRATGVRFTAATAGFLGGVWLNGITAASNTTFDITIRKSSPESITQTIQIPPSAYRSGLAAYFDLSSYKISLLANEDYYIFIQCTSNCSNFRILADQNNISNQSYYSTTGTSFTLEGNYNYRIRSLEISLQQYTAGLPAITTEKTHRIEGFPQFFTNNCELITTIVPEGSTPVAGNITAKVIINEQPNILRRIYEISPQVNGTGWTTLYYTQHDFNQFNNNAGAALLPAHPEDTGKFPNIILSKYDNLSSDGTGNHSSYSGSKSFIHPAPGNIIWNNEAMRWEVSFSVSSFSAFLIEKEIILPITLNYFNGEQQTVGNLLNWEATCKDLYEATFTLLHSTDGQNFSPINSNTYTEAGCIGKKSFLHTNPANGLNYYQLKITENGLTTHYSNIVTIHHSGNRQNSLWPNILAPGQALHIEVSENSTLYLYDVSGKTVYTQSVLQGQSSITLPLLSSGIYHYQLSSKSKSLGKGKLTLLR